jgi:type III secretory pathway component EscS
MDGRGVRFDPLVLACGVVGLLVGLGFVAVGVNSRPNTYAFVGVALIAINALVALPSPWLPQRFARASALRMALLSVFVAGFFIAWIPVSTWLGQAFANQMLQAIPTAAH